VIPTNKLLLQLSIKILATIVVNMNILAHIKFSNKLKNYTFVVCYYSYANRYRQVEKTV